MILMDYAIEPKPLYTADKPHKKLYETLSASDAIYRNHLQTALSLKDHFLEINTSDKETDITLPAWNNNYLPGLDIIMLYTLLCELKPKTYVEIGSGTSTKTANKARKDHHLNFKITCIDPHPRQEIKNIADKWYPHPVQEAPLEIFSRLQPNDIVFFDGTHTLVPNSDVMWFFLEVLPILPPGVIVQVHDIYVPYDYPQFMLDRYYSENYILGAVLLTDPRRYGMLSPNFYISEHKELSKILDPLWHHPRLQQVERHGGSFWFKINQAPAGK